MDGQTTIYPCCFCAEPSVEEIELYPIETALDKHGKKVIKRDAVNGWVCEVHKQHVEDGNGWQDRQRVAKAARSKTLKKDQLTLGDVA